MAIVRITLVIVVVVGAAIAANLALLSRAASSRDPVGRLSPVVASVTPVGDSARSPTSPATGMSRQSHDESERAGDDDD